jgi:hypothetical protein
MNQQALKHLQLHPMAHEGSVIPLSELTIASWSVFNCLVDCGASTAACSGDLQFAYTSLNHCVSTPNLNKAAYFSKR